MPDGILSFGHGEVKLGNTLLPGELKAQSIAGAIRFDEAEVEGKSGKTKKPMGWEDSDITLTVELLTKNKLTKDESTSYEKLAELNRIFKAHNESKPKIYTINNAHASARGIKEVYFSSLDSDEADEDDVITATLGFVEHRPQIIPAENRATKKDEAVGKTAPKVNAKKEPEMDASIGEDQSPFARGLSEGSS